FQLGIETEHIADLHLLVQTTLFRQIAHPVIGRGKDVLSEHTNFARIGVQDAHDHAQRRRLARAIRTDESVHRASRDLKREVLDGKVLAEGFGDLVDLDGSHRRGPFAEKVMEDYKLKIKN